MLVERPARNGARPVLPRFHRCPVTELHTMYPNTFYQLFDITWKLTPEQRWELYRLVKAHSPDCIIVDNQELAAGEHLQVVELIGSGGADRTPDLGIMRPSLYH